METIDTLDPTPFKHLVMTIGNLPSSFTDSMSYYECLAWLVKYLENTVIPAVNQNAEALEELQAAFVILKNYVDNYFDNLDVQEEINNKLDEMVEDGTMTTLLSPLVDDYVATTTARVDTLESDITIFIGDSYGANNDSGWCKYYAQSEGLTIGTDCFNYCYGGAGFTTDEHNFKTELESAVYYHNNHGGTDKVKRIICCGGWNDRGSYTQIETKVQEFMNYAKTNFPNAKVYIGMIANTNIIDDTAGDLHWRDWLQVQIMPKYKTCIKYGGIYLEGVESIMHQDYTLFNEDHVHPTDDGYKLLGYGIHQAVQSGKYTYDDVTRYISITSSQAYITLDSNVSASDLGLTIFPENGMARINLQGSVTFDTAVATTNKSLSVDLATYSDSMKIFRLVNASGNIIFNCRATLSDSSMKMGLAKLTFNRSGKVHLDIMFDSTVTVKTIAPAYPNITLLWRNM